MAGYFTIDLDVGVVGLLKGLCVCCDSEQAHYKCNKEFLHNVFELKIVCYK
jgi:hypothetical protein